MLFDGNSRERVLVSERKKEVNLNSPRSASSLPVVGRVLTPLRGGVGDGLLLLLGDLVLAWVAQVLRFGGMERVGLGAKKRDQGGNVSN